MVPFGQALGRGHAQTVHEQRLGVLSARIELGHVFLRFVADRHDLKGHDVELAALDGHEVVGQAESFTIRLAWEAKAQDLLDLATRGQ